MKFKGNLEALVLGALKEGPLHGYAIAKAIECQGAGLLKMGENQLYPTLHKLEQEGCVAAEWQPQENKPPRRIYQLTEAGRGKLLEFRSTWEKYAAGMSAILGLNAVEARNV